MKLLLFLIILLSMLLVFSIGCTPRYAITEGEIHTGHKFKATGPTVIVTDTTLHGYFIKRIR